MIKLALATIFCTALITFEATAQVRDSTPDGIGVSNRSQSFNSGNTGRGVSGKSNANRNDFVTRLTEQNLLSFLQEVQDIATGKRVEMADDEVIDYMNNHIADKAEFKSIVRYEVPGFPNKDIEMKIGKPEYINTIVKGRYTLQDYNTAVTLDDLKIENNGKRATFTSITDEQGLMPFPKDKNNPDDIEILPIKGTTKCAQVMIVSFNNFIQMATANCRTIISFDPFAGKPLIPD